MGVGGGKRLGVVEKSWPAPTLSPPILDQPKDVKMPTLCGSYRMSMPTLAYFTLDFRVCRFEP